MAKKYSYLRPGNTKTIVTKYIISLKEFIIYNLMVSKKQLLHYLNSVSVIS